MVEMVMICKRSNWRSVLVLLWMLNSNVESEIIRKPVDTEVVIGESTHLNCSTSDASGDINWYHQQVGKGSIDIRYVFMSGQMLRPYNKRFRIEKDSSTEAFNLVISKVEVEDAGRYICQNGGEPATAELILLASLPTCMSNLNSVGFIGPNSCGLMKEKIQLSCGIKYNGNVPPKLQWTRIKHGKSFPISEPCIVSDGRVTCNYTAEADMEIDGSSFICQSNRAIDTQYNCTTEPIYILYLNENKTRIPKTIGDEVTCSANTSSTDCNYKWVWYDGDYEETVSDDRTLIIKREGLHRCEANCSIKDFRCLVNAMTIKSPAIFVAPVIDSNTAIVVVGAAVILLVCLCLIIVFLLVYFKRKVSALRRRAGINEAAAAATAAAEIVPSEQGRPPSAENSELPAKNYDVEANYAGNYGKCAESKPLMTLRHQQESENSDIVKQSQWKCKRCAFINLEENVSCKMCDSPKSHEPSATDEK